jgi:hypothetical protein
MIHSSTQHESGLGLRSYFTFYLQYIEIVSTGEYSNLHARFDVFSKIRIRILSYVDKLNSTGVPVVIPLADEKPATVSRTYCA